MYKMIKINCKLNRKIAKGIFQKFGKE